MNYATTEEIARIHHLLNYLNESFVGNIIDAEVVLTDSNGDSMGVLKWADNGETYIWEMPS